ncbi:MAG: recombinase family protein, partial [Polyangiaceae bacterium]
MKAAILCRLSKEDADGKRSGIESTGVQLANARAAIEGQGWTVADGCTWVFDDVSGADMGRRLDAVIASAKAGNFDVLVARDLDRLVREAARQAAVLVQLGDAGVRVWTYNDRRFATLAGLDGAMTYLRGVIAEEERAKTSARVREALRFRAQAGRPAGQVPFGYRIERDASGAPVERIDEAKAAVVVHVFETFAKLGTYHATADALNTEGVASPSGGTWPPQSVKNMVCNPVYRGLVVRGRKQYVPQRGRIVCVRADESTLQRVKRPELRLVSPELIARVDAVMARPRRSFGAAKVRHLASSFVRCGVCGASLTVTGAKTSCYGCARQHGQGKAACGGIGYRAEYVVDGAILASLAPLFGATAVKRTIASIEKKLDNSASPEGRASDRRRVERAIAECARKQKNLAASIADGAAPAAVLTLLREEEARAAKMRDELGRLDAAPPATLARRRVLA